MPDLEDVRRIGPADNHLAVFAVADAPGQVHASVVSAGVIDDPVDGAPGVAAVVAGGARKLRLLRTVGRATLVFKSGWDWVSVSGPTRLVGPDEGDLGLDVPETIRSVFRAAGGTHEDWGEFDRVMADERRCAVFVRAERITSNAGSA
jgi:hypothetical protein